MADNEAGSFDRSLHVLPNDTPVCCIDCSDAFDRLSERERAWAHHMSRACWLGANIIYHQVSPEAPVLCAVLSRVFAAQGIAGLQALAKHTCAFTDADWTAFTVFTAGLLHNCGNYSGRGDTKFVPDVDVAKLDALMAAAGVSELWQSIQPAVYSLADNRRALGLPLLKGTTTYYSSNITETDIKLASKCLSCLGIEPCNTRLFKHSDTQFDIRFASVETGEFGDAVEFEGVHFRLVKGDYSELLRRVVRELQLARPFAANKLEENMIDAYVKHFTTGSLNAHKQASRHWVSNAGPAVETYLGFIESYRDPAGVRCEFEGFVACVHRWQSLKLARLVDSAERLLRLLPWGADYEKDVFVRPDFTSLDVLTFGASGPPTGINIPNYDDVRESEGFKNVSLGNVIAAALSSSDSNISFLSPHDQVLFKKHYKKAFEIQVGLHELLGHGSGKLFYKYNDGSYNFDVDRVKDLQTGGKISSWYGEGESFGSVFGGQAAVLEECRAEAVGLLLCCEPEVLTLVAHKRDQIILFDCDGAEASDVQYVNWLTVVMAGLLALEVYAPETQAWGQAEAQACHVLLRLLLEVGLVNIEEDEQDILLTCDRQHIASTGRAVVATLLTQLQLYKSTACVGSAASLLARHSRLDERWLRLRRTVLLRRTPRPLNLQHNTTISDNGCVSLVSYPATPVGLIASHLDRFASEDGLWMDMLAIADKDRVHWNWTHD